MKRLFVLLLFSAAVHAQTFVCGASACIYPGVIGGPENGPLPTGIDGLMVDGAMYNVAFSATQSTGFQGQAALDAGTAMANFFSSQSIPDPENNFTQGFFYSLNGEQMQGANIETTVFQNGTTAYIPVFLDATLGVITGQINPFPDYRTACADTVTCTTWTPVSAPELGDGWTVALTLLAGILATRRRA